ncbi:hypothetical protein KC19_7G088500 [Ceratodon purpureus]|uniref:F-box domain-containing protein n=1 Tax=Ceratodon purpureus TaxID=3225 RepID=A0A8T0H4E4_CERPU|nr:hypothetical protein KC19_7G088500 [Ceratodon purpureus]
MHTDVLAGTVESVGLTFRHRSGIMKGAVCVTRSWTQYQRSWSRLPDDISERVLYFLDVRDLCRCRAVCRKWNELVRKLSFLDLSTHEHTEHRKIMVLKLFSLDDREHRQFFNLTRYSTAQESQDQYRNVCRRSVYNGCNGCWTKMFMYVDLNVPQLVAFGDDLVCEFSWSMNSRNQVQWKYIFFMFDPLAPPLAPERILDGKTVSNSVENLTFPSGRRFMLPPIAAFCRRSQLFGSSLRTTRKGGP